MTDDQPRGMDREGSKARSTTFANLWPVPALGEAESLERESRCRHERDVVYRERAFVVALAVYVIAHYSPWFAFLRYDSSLGWDEDWRWTVVIRFSSVGEVSWHIHDNELPLFDLLVRVTIQPDGNSAAFQSSINGDVTIGNADGYRYDGHSTDEKYRRIWQFVTGQER